MVVWNLSCVEFVCYPHVRVTECTHVRLLDESKLTLAVSVSVDSCVSRLSHCQVTSSKNETLVKIFLAGFSIAGPSSTPRKRQVRFSARHDILLLREVIAQNPFTSKESGRIWARVGEIVTRALLDENFEVDGRRCRERTMLLLDYYKKQDFPSLRRLAGSLFNDYIPTSSMLLQYHKTFEQIL